MTKRRRKKTQFFLLTPEENPIAPLPRCHLCRTDTELVRSDGDPSLWWCSDAVGCDFRARRRLHVPAEIAEQLREEERAARGDAA